MSETLKTDSIKKMLEDELTEILFNMCKGTSESFMYSQGRFLQVLNISSKLGFVYPTSKAQFGALVKMTLQKASEPTEKTEEVEPSHG